MINGLPKLLFFNFYFFQISNGYCQKSYRNPSFFMNFEGSNEVLLRHKYFWSTYFWQWNDSPFKIFWNFYGNAFVSLFFLNGRNILSTLLMIHLKCTVVYYSNLIWNSINKWAVEYAISIFRFLIYVFFKRGFCQNLYEKSIIINKNFQNSFQDLVYYRILGC